MQTHKHKFIPSLTCQIVAETKKGFKVVQIDNSKKNLKAKTTFYDSIDFDDKKGFWIKISNS